MNGFLVSYYLHSNPLNNRAFLKLAHVSLPHGVFFSICTVHMKLLMLFLGCAQMLRDYHPVHLVRRACLGPEEKGQNYFNHFSEFLILLAVNTSMWRGAHFS